MKKLIALAVALVCSANGPVRAEDKVDFAKQIQPILRQNCVKCHGPEKQKGKLRLDSKEAAMPLSTKLSLTFESDLANRSPNPG